MYVVTYATRVSNPTDLANAGFVACSRPLCSQCDQTALTHEEAKEISSTGMRIIGTYPTILVSQHNVVRQGRVDASAAQHYLSEAGAPSSAVTYFDIDDDDKLITDQTVCNYFSGIAEMMPVSQIGVRARSETIRALIENKLSDWYWQTDTANGSRIMADAHLKALSFDSIPDAPDYRTHVVLREPYGGWAIGDASALTADPQAFSRPVTTNQRAIARASVGQGAQLDRAADISATLRVVLSDLSEVLDAVRDIGKPDAIAVANELVKREEFVETLSTMMAMKLRSAGLAESVAAWIVARMIRAAGEGQ